MDEELEFVKAKLQYYYALLRKADRLAAKIEELEYRSVGVKGVNLQVSKYQSSVDRNHKLTDLVENKSVYENEMNKVWIEAKKLRMSIDLDCLDAEQKRLVKMVFYEGMAYDKVAQLLHYSGKSSIYKIMRKVLSALC